MRTLLLLLLSPVALAGPLYEYQFAVTATNGSLAGQSSIGRLIYRAPDVIPPNNQAVIDLPFLEFDFSWNGISYSTANVPGWTFATLKDDGSLKFGEGTGSFGTGDLIPFVEGWRFTYFHHNTVSSLGLPEFFFQYRSPVDDGGSGEGSFSLLRTFVPVPSPNTLLLLLAAIPLVMLRRRSAPERTARRSSR